MSKNDINNIISLNIGENYLSNWEVYQAIRELIANAIDSVGGDNTKVYLDYSDSTRVLTIQDEGSGIEPENFKINQNIKNDNNRIGRFGIGLKDAIAVLKSRDRDIVIETSKYKYDFFYNTNDIIGKVLNVRITKKDSSIKGTKVTISNIDKISEYEKAKDQFSCYSKKIIDKNDNGEIIEEEKSSIYYFGVKINEFNSNKFKYRFSYNITKKCKGIEKALNRERMYVDRGKCTESIKKIIKSSTNKYVHEEFIKKLDDKGSLYKELDWGDVLDHVVSEIKKYRDICLITKSEMDQHKQFIFIIQKEYAIQLIFISDKDRKHIKINKQELLLNRFKDKYKSINIKELDDKQKHILKIAKSIFLDNIIIDNKKSIDRELIENIIIVSDECIISNNERILIKINQLNRIEEVSYAILEQVDNLFGTKQFKEFFIKRILEHIGKIIDENNLE